MVMAMIQVNNYKERLLYMVGHGSNSRVLGGVEMLNKCVLFAGCVFLYFVCL